MQKPLSLLSGYGAGLIRARDLATRVQSGLERLYQLDRVVDVEGFIEPADEGGREQLLVHASADGALELRLLLPVDLRDKSAGGMSFDHICQIIEGVSHFVLVTDRAQEAREVSQLELEVQAEVDKFVVLGSAVPKLDKAAADSLCGRLYESVQFAHAGHTEQGERYRLANETAHKFVRHLSRDNFTDLRKTRAELRAFYRQSQAEKLRVAA
jgi:hypothetical protein